MPSTNGHGSAHKMETGFKLVPLLQKWGCTDSEPCCRLNDLHCHLSSSTAILQTLLMRKECSNRCYFAIRCSWSPNLRSHRDRRLRPPAHQEFRLIHPDTLQLRRLSTCSYGVALVNQKMWEFCSMAYGLTNVQVGSYHT